MRSAAIRVLLFVLLALGGVSSSAATAGVEVDPIGTVTSAISTITSQTTVVSDLTGSGSSLTDAISGSTDTVSESGVLSGSGTTDATSSDADGGSGSATSGDGSSRSAKSSNRGSPHTKFDRLPRRYEALLERIESGRNVRANTARLLALLESASPQFRARVMRLIRAEIRRLERGGLTQRERAAAERLRRLLTTLRGPATQGQVSPGWAEMGWVESSGIRAATASGGGFLAASAGSASRLADRPPTDGRDAAGSADPELPIPLLPSPSGPYWPLLLLAAIAGLVLLLNRAPRHLLLSPVRGVVGVQWAEMWVLAVVLVLGLAAGLLTVLLVQTVLL